MYDTSSSSSAAASAPSPVVLVFYAVLTVVLLVAMWKIFTKAGVAGWKSIVPFYNSYTLLKISGMSGWWLLAFFVPVLNIVALLLTALNLAKSFGRSNVFAIVGLFLFTAVGFLMLGFGKSIYIGPGGLASAPVAPIAPVV